MYDIHREVQKPVTSAFIFLERHPEIRQSHYWGGHLWSPGYYMSTLGNMSKDVVEKYISNQKYNETKNKPYKNKGPIHPMTEVTGWTDPNSFKLRVTLFLIF
jgi:hypothetical protein